MNYGRDNDAIRRPRRSQGRPASHSAVVGGRDLTSDRRLRHRPGVLSVRRQTSDASTYRESILLSFRYRYYPVRWLSTDGLNLKACVLLLISQGTR